MAVANLIDAAEAVAGRGSARAPSPSDAVDGVTPQVIVEPSDAQAVANTLSWAFREKLSVLIRGSGTKLGWGPTPRAFDVLLSTTRLNSVTAHRHGDLTATVQAGATLAHTNEQLARHRQWIPLDPPAAGRATIGGLVATNDSGPRRHRYGAPRDLIIGVELARADGRIAKGGGIVVKNVAGYDLPRLMTGSFGSLGVILSATFKLYPMPTASRTVVVDLRDPAELGTLAAKVLASPLAPTTLEFELSPPQHPLQHPSAAAAPGAPLQHPSAAAAPGAPLRALIRFESIETAVEQQAQEAFRLARNNSSRIVGGEDEEALWEQHSRRPWDGDGAVVKVSVLPTELPGLLRWLSQSSGSTEVSGRAGLSVFLARIGGSAEAQARLISGLRDMSPPGRGSVVIVRGSPELKSLVDVWGPIGDGLPLMRAVKQQFDPAGILNPGRGPGGI